MTVNVTKYTRQSKGDRNWVVCKTSEREIRDDLYADIKDLGYAYYPLNDEWWLMTEDELGMTVVRRK